MRSWGRRAAGPALACVLAGASAGCSPPETSASHRAPVVSGSASTPVPSTGTPAGASPPQTLAGAPAPDRASGGRRAQFATISFVVPAGWRVDPQAPLLGDPATQEVCVQPDPAPGTGRMFGCAGLQVDHGHLYGAEAGGDVGTPWPAGAYRPDEPAGWYQATDVQPCPAPAATAAPGSGGFDGVQMPSPAPVATGFRPVGGHTAAYDRWSATCTSGYTFTPQAWYLPDTQYLFKDYTDHPQTAAILASVRFADAAPSATPSPPSCAQRTSGSYVEATTATTGPDGSTSVQGHPARLVCGGADDFHFAVDAATTTLHLVPGARVSVVTTGGSTGSGIRQEPLPAGHLGRWLSTDQSGRVFAVDGPPAAVTALDEQHHP